MARDYSVVYYGDDSVRVDGIFLGYAEDRDAADKLLLNHHLRRKLAWELVSEGSSVRFNSVVAEGWSWLEK